ncbi:MAG TPA: hypothetical protein VFV68_17175 [Agriterribacter sp.]|nr:hypothetical protein [Agriterribacter sp.]
MLQLPVTIRVPLPGEMPDRDDLEALLWKRQKARIEPGYKITLNSITQLRYTFQAEINIDNPKLWDLVLALSVLLPEEIYCEYGLHQEEVVTTAYMPKTKLLAELSKYKQELTQDGFLQFTLLSNTKTELLEIAVTESKYIRFSGSNKENFIQCMQSFDLPEIADLAFIDEYPSITEPLKKFVPTARRPEDVVWSLNRFFGINV